MGRGRERPWWDFANRRTLAQRFVIGHALNERPNSHQSRGVLVPSYELMDHPDALLLQSSGTLYHRP